MERSLRAARVATFSYFVLDGTLMGMWLVQIPAIEKRVGISNATLGSLLVLLGLGAFLGMQVAGRLADRLGTRVVVRASGVLLGASLVLPGFARDPWVLAGALLVFGFGNGCLDVSMNAHAVHVEKAYRRPVMSAFHAAFSVGGVIAALVGGRAIGAGISPAVTLGAAGAVGVVVALLSARGLLATTSDDLADPAGAAGTTEGHPTDQGAKRRTRSARIWILAALALMCMLCEGAANDWSTLEAKTVLGAPAATAAFAYGTFAATMTIGRLLADRVSGRFGSAAVLRYGAAAGAVGITVVALAPSIWVALLGWALFGLGLSGCVPQLFSAAGHTDPAAAGTNVSRVAGLGYLGMLAGPAVIGWMTRLVALNYALLFPALLLVVAAVTAGILRTGFESASEPASEPGSEPASEPEPEPGPRPAPAQRP
ncbi:MFS transporter [Streptacidiphilus sp. P02-A3a]|uniref:MFS transporter n=1 Tax=Streptacidiphilus sp. P02-A3a TaxID=2704468 RepID=UPI0015FCF2B2|nr:MFS transporter [Streptacidiphilus sp. P02-A3a]QMU68375.1 MFS transporter [Streptacidiphilus sp. P02-A3a]